MGKMDQGVQGSDQKYRTIPRVLVFMQNNEDVLLLKGADDKRIWANKFNGVGGHVEENEDILTAARREVYEETGLKPKALLLRAVVNIDAGEPLVGILIFVFTAWISERNTRRSEEGELFWIPVDEVHNHDLVEDLYWLLPRVLGEDSRMDLLFLHYHYDESDELIISEHQR